MDFSFSSTAFIAIVFVVAGLVKGVIGLGLPTVSMGLLVLALAPAQAAALIVIPSLITNVWQMAAGPRLRPLAARLWAMMAALIAGTVLGSLVLALSEAAAVTLGVALVVYAAASLTPARLSVPRAAEFWLGPLAGAVTGVVTAATGVFVIPAVPYLQAIGLERDDLVQALGLSFTVSTLALAAALAGKGLFGAEVGAASVAALAPSLVGMLAGQWIRSRIEPAVFRVCFFVGLLLLGLHLALRSVL